MINYAVIDRKIASIQQKDREALVAAKVYVPFLGNTYTVAQVDAWLNYRADFLIEARTLTEAAMATKVDGLYKTLSTADKAIADQIRNGLEYNLAAASDATAYDKLCLIALHKMATTTV